ncbi:hypothetical protein GGI42DRAFT_91631 [Trichoderma sp. SZMC 28013]
MGRWFCVSASVSGTLALWAQATRGDATRMSHLLPYQTSESPAITTSCISTIPSDCRSGPAAQRSVVTAQARLHPCAIWFPCMEYREGTTVSCRCHQCHPGRWLRWAGLGIVAPPFQLLARTTPSIHAAEYVLHVLLLILLLGFGQLSRR